MTDDKKGQAVKAYFGFREYAGRQTLTCLTALETMHEMGFDLNELLECNLTLLERAYIEKLLAK